MTRLAIIYYSATGNVHRLARAMEEGALAVGAEVRLRRVAELVPDEIVRSSPDWAQHRADTAHVPEAELADLEWADALLFGTPTRYGNVSSQLKQFLDSTAGLWSAGKLADKAVSGFVCTAEQHGGQESTLLSMYNVFMHWGSIIVPVGYTDDAVFAGGGNPYGVSSAGVPDETRLAVARFQAGRVVEKARALSRQTV